MCLLITLAKGVMDPINCWESSKHKVPLIYSLDCWKLSHLRLCLLPWVLCVQCLVDLGYKFLTFFHSSGQYLRVSFTPWDTTAAWGRPWEQAKSCPWDVCCNGGQPAWSRVRPGWCNALPLSKDTSEINKSGVCGWFVFFRAAFQMQLTVKLEAFLQIPLLSIIRRDCSTGY